MFTLDQIHEASKKVKSGADFPMFIQELKTMGVTHYENEVADGRTQYFGFNNFVIDAGPKYPLMVINDRGSSEKLKTALSTHQQGLSDYPTFCQQAAEAGVKKWATHILEMTVTYFDKEKNKLLAESIPQP